MAEQPQEGLGDETFAREESEEIDDVVQQCIEDTNECQLVCTETVTYLLQVEDHSATGHIRILMDCADACLLTTTFLLRRSEFAPRACSLTAEVCERCAEQCDHFPDDQWMVECSETCRRCADSCREVAAI